MRRTLALAAVAAVAVISTPRFAHATPSKLIPVENKTGAKLPTSFASKPAPGTRARCPVSGEAFTVTERTQTVTYGGRVYALCCPDCKPDFEKNPAKYADKK